MVSLLILPFVTDSKTPFFKEIKFISDFECFLGPDESYEEENMKKQTTAAVVIILITCLLGYGVTSIFDMTALERLTAIMNANANLTSYHMDVEGQMKMRLQSEKEIPEYMSNAFEMSDNMKLKIQADVVMKPDNIQMKMLEQVDMDGMAFDVEIYIDNDQMILKYPIIGDYILITVDDITELADIKLPETFMQDIMELLPEIQIDSAEILMSHLNENNVRYVEPYIMDSDGYEQTLNVVEITMDSEILIHVYADLILSLLENEKGIALVNSVLDANDEVLPDNFIDDLNTLKKAVSNVKDPESDSRHKLNESFGVVLDNLKYTYKVGLTNLNIPKMMWLNMDMTVPMDGMDDANVRIVYDLEYRMSKFNEIDTIEIPEIAEDDMIRISDLIEKFGGY